MSEREKLYQYMRQERVNVEFMWPRPEEEEFVISCRFREWSAGRNAGRMILAGGRTLDEALAYAYMGMIEGFWIQVDWRLRASTVGVVSTVSEKPTPMRRPIALNAILSEQLELFPIDDPSWGRSVPQNGAQEQPEGPNKKDKARQTT